jgi:type I restriction enzyme R subunit
MQFAAWPGYCSSVAGASHLLPEQQARVLIDAMLNQAGWLVQDYKDADINAGPGVAIREVPTASGPMDYMLVADGKVVGSLEAKKAGETLRGKQSQADRYADGFEELVQTKPYPRYADRLPFHYMSTGTETLFTSRRDPIVRPREVFHFHKSETLAAWAQEEVPYRVRLQHFPPVNPNGLRDIQVTALTGNEQSLAADKPRSLVAITMGGGKTICAVAETYRLLTYAKANRILFLVDRVSLGEQAEKAFLSYVSPDDGRRFGDLYGLQVLKSNRVDRSANVIICTIQRLYSILRGEEDLDEEIDEGSSFELGGGAPAEVAYNADVPVEFFDIIFVDECHRSIYGRWGQVLDYFDAPIVGLTATPTKATLAYFDDNVVAEYTHEQSVFDQVNVDQQLYRIRTEVGEKGATINAGEWVKVRDRGTRKVDYRQLDDEFIYDEAKLDRAVVNPSQIRAVVRTFKERVQTEMFPDRDEVPKTIFFAKNDQHAEDILKIIWEEYGRGSDFAKKITYKAEGRVQDNIQAFRNDPRLRIAVTVEQIGTGTDIKSVECVVFMRMVGSRTLLNQMRGRAVRTIDDNEFFAVTPGAKEKGQTKEYSVLVDAIGITEEDVVLRDAEPTTTKNTVPFENLLRDIGMGLTDDDTLNSAAIRLGRLHKRLTEDEREEFAQTAGGTSLTEMVKRLREATSESFQIDTARAQTGENEPSDKQVEAARQQLVQHAVAQLRRVEVREKLRSLSAQVTEQLIHVYGHDETTFAGFIDTPDAAKGVLDEWRDFIETNHDEYVALRAYYSEPYRRRVTLKDIKELAAAISRPPYNLTPIKIWVAYEALEADRVKGRGGQLTTDLVRLIRFALERDQELIPYEDAVRMRFDIWVTEQESDGRKFTADQMRWLELVRDHIAASMNFDPAEDYDLSPFAEEGGINAAYELFGNDLNAVVEELNEALVAA